MCETYYIDDRHYVLTHFSWNWIAEFVISAMAQWVGLDCGGL
jgi:hypothetical protein